ncbi:unnamed protein product [Prunus brigantina]
MKFSETIVAMVLGIALSFNIVGNMSCNAAGQYDYFQFVQESPFAFCKDSNGNGCNILPLPRIFTIHKSWPNTQLELPTTLSLNPLMNEASNDELRADLELSWRSFISGRSNMDFWEYEYSTHGKCSDHKFSQTQYFDRARSLWKQYKAHTLFSNRSVEPGKSYRFTDLEQAIRSFIGERRPLLLCKQSNGKKTKQYLLEVVICFDDRAINPVNCPKRRMSKECHPQSPCMGELSYIDINLIRMEYIIYELMCT